MTTFDQTLSLRIRQEAVFYLGQITGANQDMTRRTNAFSLAKEINDDPQFIIKESENLIREAVQSIIDNRLDEMEAPEKP